MSILESLLTSFWEFLRQYANYLDIVGGAIILLSWVISNTIYNRLKEATATLQRASSERNLEQALESIRRKYRETKATLSRVDLMLSEMRPDSNFSTFPKHLPNQAEHIQTYALMQTAETGFFEHEDLQSTIALVDSLSNQQGISKALAIRTNNILNSSRDIMKKFELEVQKWDASRKENIRAIESGSSKDTDILRLATQEFIKAGFPLQVESTKLRGELLNLYSDLLNHHLSRMNKLKKLNSWYEKIAWFFYVLGTIVVILGKALKL